MGEIPCFFVLVLLLHALAALYNAIVQARALFVTGNNTLFTNLLLLSTSTFDYAFRSCSGCCIRTKISITAE